MYASAYIVGGAGEPARMVIAHAQRAGFSAIRPFESMREVEDGLAERPLAFFLFPPIADLALLSDVIGRLRTCKRQDVRFMPLIHFCTTASREVIRGCMALGFDDVVAMPMGTAALQDRLMRQIDRETAYIEAARYFGPERRKTPRRGDIPHVMRFTRSAASGIQVLADNLSAA